MAVAGSVAAVFLAVAAFTAFDADGFELVKGHFEMATTADCSTIGQNTVGLGDKCYKFYNFESTFTEFCYNCEQLGGKPYKMLEEVTDLSGLSEADLDIRTVARNTFEGRWWVGAFLNSGSNKIVDVDNNELSWKHFPSLQNSIVNNGDGFCITLFQNTYEYTNCTEASYGICERSP